MITSKVYPTTIGEGVSITNDEKNALMAPSIHTLTKVSNKITNILKTHIEEFNQQEAVIFTTEQKHSTVTSQD